jgi:hypothetical protein
MMLLLLLLRLLLLLLLLLLLAVLLNQMLLLTLTPMLAALCFIFCSADMLAMRAVKEVGTWTPRLLKMPRTSS